MSDPGRSVEEASDLRLLAAQALSENLDYSVLHNFEVHSGIPERAHIVALLCETGAPKPGGFGSGTWKLASLILGNELPVPIAQAAIAAVVLSGARCAVQFNKERGLTGYRRIYIGSLARNAPKEPTAPGILCQLLAPGITPAAFFRLVETVEPC